MSGLFDHYGMWNAERTFTLFVCLLLALTFLLLLCASWAAGRAALAARTWKRRYDAKSTECAALRDALTDARYRTGRRPAPAPVGEWLAPVDKQRSHRYWTTALAWPGTAPGELPVIYGDGRDAALVDPCLAAPPDDQTLHAWLTEPQAQSFPPLTTGELLVERALDRFEREADPRQVFVAHTPRRHLEVAR